MRRQARRFSWRRASGGGESDLGWSEDFVGWEERRFGLDHHAEFHHRRSEALPTEALEGLLTLPRVHVVVVSTLPPREVGDPAHRRFAQPAALFANGVVLLC